ncbi:HET-domain-containing protein [Xylaria bambusicola]|uniref:HET-domain-containing protein n=1 Tax=Xylaria bambusicola TaxID=326684 RepID=UPI002007AFA0|nr:HET-domain-containing protein [Xylaria bambusicola]KAI0515447.1 HET-domain-containing protein [Xylaria bambusicola]
MGYIYEPLPAGPFIRLLQVVDLDPASGQAVCDFNIVCLDGKSVPEYTAVSYTWDHPATHVSSITFSNSPLSSLPLSQTLHDLFKELQARNERRALWIDALCIDQGNAAERAAQVAMMDRVFSSARRVMVWLGPSTPETHEAFQFVNSKQHLSCPTGWDSVPDADIDDLRAGLESVLSAILARPWFRRIWVVQEAALNRSVQVVCGSDSTGIGALQSCVLALWKFAVDWEPFDVEPTVLGLWCVTRLLAIRDEFLERGSVRIEKLLQQAYCCDCTDQRDAVFAFLGLADKQLALPAPDYTVPIGDEPEYAAAVDRVYYDTAVALLCHGPSLDALALAGITLSHRSGVPSWVPDLRYVCFEDPFTTVDKTHWNAGGPIAGNAELVAPGKLKVHCSVFDTVDTLCAKFDGTDVPAYQEAMRDVLALASKLLKQPISISPSSRAINDKNDGDAEEEERNDVLLDRLVSILTFGLGVDGKPIGPEYRGFFDDWLRWLQTNPADADFSEIHGNAFYRALYTRLEGWRVFGTGRGFFGIGSSQVEVGDKVCIVPGCRFPLLIKPKQGFQGPVPSTEALLVYWCYVDGLMDGGWLDTHHADIELILC